MRLTALFILTLVGQLANAQNVSLKIQMDDTYYYPSDMKFEVIDEAGDIVLTQNDLEIAKPIIVEGDHTINVFTTWGDGKDTYRAEDKILIALEVNNEKYDFSFEEKSWTQNQPKIVAKKFEENNGRYDALIEFEKGILFNYSDGEAKITQEGKTLDLLGNYVAKTSEGFLKMSYNPDTKEYWYVFTDSYKGVINK